MSETRQEVRGKHAGTPWFCNSNFNALNNESEILTLLRPRHSEGSEVWDILRKNQSWDE